MGAESTTVIDKLIRKRAFRNSLIGGSVLVITWAALKQLARKVLPSPARRLANRVIKKFNYQGGPRITKFQGTSNSVLQCCIAYNAYGGYCIPLSSRHRAAARRILAGDIWEPKTLEFVISQCGDGDIIHAGTFFGDFLPALSNSAALGAKVWAFEPNPENYRCALITIYLNGLQNVELMNAGLGEQQGFLSMMTTDTRGRSLGGGSVIEEEGHSSSDSPTVKIVTVDEIVPSDRMVSIIQLDVEGFEGPALKGALSTIKRCKPIIVLEALPEQGWLSENILQLGYRIAGNVDGNTILRTG